MSKRVHGTPFPQTSIERAGVTHYNILPSLFHYINITGLLTNVFQIFYNIKTIHMNQYIIQTSESEHGAV